MAMLNNQRYVFSYQMGIQIGKWRWSGPDQISGLIKSKFNHQKQGVYYCGSPTWGCMGGWFLVKLLHSPWWDQTYNFISYNNHRSYIRKISTPCAAFGFSTQQWCHTTQSAVDSEEPVQLEIIIPFLRIGKQALSKPAKSEHHLPGHFFHLFSLPGFSQSADQHTAVATVRAA